MTRRKTISAVLALVLALSLLPGCEQAFDGLTGKGRTAPGTTTFDLTGGEKEDAGNGGAASGAAAADPAKIAERTAAEKGQALFAVNGYVLSGDGEYEYAYNDKGLCIEARSEDGETLTFSYEYDGEGRPVVRYVEADSEKSILEKYEYDGEGRLRRLTVYEGDEERSVWEYDEKGRVARGRGLPVTVPMLPGLPYSEAENVQWDSEGRLLSASFPLWRPLDGFAYSALGSAAAADQIDALCEQLREVAKSAGMEANPDGLYLSMRITEEFQYDRAGRATLFSIVTETTPLEIYARTGTAKAQKAVDSIEITYRSASIHFLATSYRYTDGVLVGDPMRVEWDYEIVAGSGSLPVEAGGLSTDVYGALDCRVDSAEIGLFGILWREGVTNVYGELHGGFIGLDPTALRPYLRQGLFQCMHITGTGPNGEAVEYFLWPDMMGRQRCQKFTDGLYTMPASDEMDLKKQKQYVMEYDQDEYTYRLPEEP